MSSIPEHCSAGAKALDQAEIRALLQEIDGAWRADEELGLMRQIEAADFKAALGLVNAIGAIAESENHHPDLSITDYRIVTIRLITHDAGGVTGNDFSLARRIDAIT